jgi:D-alanyl-D-alanine carboxypeptidase
MKISKLLLFALVLLSACRKVEEVAPAQYACNFNFADSSQAHPQRAAYQVLLDDMTRNGVVGATMSVYDPDQGMWLGASGKADLHAGIPMQACNLSRMGSTVKMFTATVILKLQEEGKLQLDDKLSSYLQGDNIDKIKNAEVATIRQLLQHSSGIYNYIQNLQFQTASLNDLLKPWHAEDLLQYAYHQEPYFAPGEDLRYSNTNYILLGLLIEKLEGKPLYQVFEDKIFAPLGLASTQFAGKNPVPDGIARGYIDIYSNLQVIEGTYYSGWDYYSADGGLISNPYDMNVFFRALMHGQIINQNSLDEMLTLKTPKESDPAFYEVHYGLGIFQMTTEKGLCYFHSGDAIGYYASMFYFPEDSTTVVYAVNSNYGKIDAFVSTKEAMGRILSGTKR